KGDDKFITTDYLQQCLGKYIDVWHYPDGHKELRLNDVQLPYSTYDRLSEVDPVAIVDNKRLGHVLEVSRQVQRKRDNNRSQSIPSGDEPSRRRHAPSINKPQRSLNEEDMLEAIIKLQGSSEAIFGKR
ncbi:TPA: ISNCY family transposase, partial [Escherichia coli]|nr:ISNCY family transposase [Escherichia coli]